jgi:hypothetical protein
VKYLSIVSSLVHYQTILCFLSPPSPQLLRTSQRVSSTIPQLPNVSSAQGGSTSSTSSRGGALPDRRYPQRERSTNYKNIGKKNGFLTVKQANRRYPNMVDQAVRKELQQLRERGTFTPVHGAPKGHKPVHSSVVIRRNSTRMVNSRS